MSITILRHITHLLHRSHRTSLMIPHSHKDMLRTLMSLRHASIKIKLFGRLDTILTKELRVALSLYFRRVLLT